MYFFLITSGSVKNLEKDRSQKTLEETSGFRVKVFIVIQTFPFPIIQGLISNLFNYQWQREEPQERQKSQDTSGDRRPPRKDARGLISSNYNLNRNRTCHFPYFRLS
jgi:hypothetical protein